MTAGRLLVLSVKHLSTLALPTSLRLVFKEPLISDSRPCGKRGVRLRVGSSLGSELELTPAGSESW